MSNTVVKEKKVKKTLAEKTKELLERDNSLDIIDHSLVPVVEKKVKKVKKVKPVVEVEPEPEPAVVLVIEEVEPTHVEVEVEPEPAVVLVIEEVQPTPVEVEVEVEPVVVPVIETEQEIFRRLSREKRQARLAKLSAEELAEKKRIACENNKTYRASNPDKIKEKDKVYNAENKDTRKEKRDAKLKDPVEREKHNKQQRESKAKKRAEVKASAEPKPKKEKKLTKAQKKDAINNNPDLTLEEKYELILALV